MFTTILSIIAALFVANLFTTVPILAAWYCNLNKDQRDKKTAAVVLAFIIAVNVWFIYNIIVNA